jgi:hypothetical protein
VNVIESLFKGGGQSTMPLHVGEVSALWALCIAVHESRTLCQLMLNHTNDPDLRNTIEHLISDVEAPLFEKLNKVLRNEGVPMAPISAEKAKANEREIPAGAKLNDLEIANLVVIKLEGMLMLAHTGLVQSLRDDVGALLLDTYNRLIAQGFTLKKTMRERGWLRLPPPYAVSHQAPGR